MLKDKDYLQLININLWNTIPDKTEIIRVGFLRPSSFEYYLKHEKNINILFEIAKDNGVELFFFTPADINFKSKIITGKYLVGGNIIQKDTIYPDIIDNMIFVKNMMYIAE